MAFFENVGKKLTATSKITTVTAKTFAGNTKLNSNISKENQKIQDLYLQIGKLYYEQFRDIPAESLREYVEAITASNEKIADYQKQIEENSVNSKKEVAEIKSDLEETILQEYQNTYTGPNTNADSVSGMIDGSHSDEEPSENRSSEEEKTSKSGRKLDF